MRCDVRKIATAFYDMRTAMLTIFIDKEHLRDLPDLSKPLTLSIEPKRKPRSLSANAFMWELCEKLALWMGTGITKDDVYREAVRSVGPFSTVRVRTEAKDALIYGWQFQGLGWVVQVVYSDISWTDVQLYYGSSTYNTAEMARLIDYLLDECSQAHIPLYVPREYREMHRQQKRSGP